MNGADERAALAHDGAVNHIFGCALALAGILERCDLSEDVARQLGAVLEELDRAANAVRVSAFTARLADRPRRAAAGREARGAVAPRPIPAWSAAGDGRRRLCRFGDDAFAYVLHGRDIYRQSDHELWAHEVDGVLRSARSDIAFARRDGRVFYDLETDLPLYYEDDHITELHSDVEAEAPHPRDAPKPRRAVPVAREGPRAPGTASPKPAGPA